MGNQTLEDLVNVCHQARLGLVTKEAASNECADWLTQEEPSNQIEVDMVQALREEMVEASRPFQGEDASSEEDSEELEDVNMNFVQKLEARERFEEPSKSAGGVGLAPQQMLPPRNNAIASENHIIPTDEHQGLVHGGTVVTKDFVVKCRVFRWFSNDSNLVIHNLFKGKSTKTTYYTEQVAGVCQQFDHDGNLLDTWSTARFFKQRYASVDSELINGACQFVFITGKGLNTVFEGFYRPKVVEGEPTDVIRKQYQDLREKEKDMKKILGTPVFFPDVGDLDDKFYSDKSASQLFGKKPNSNLAVENALFNLETQPSKAFPINTPYLKVFSPSPNTNRVIVSMVGAYRKASSVNKHTKNFERSARWYTKTFSL